MGNMRFGKNQTSEWSRWNGHGGDTYVFRSQQGFIPAAGASFSVVQNTDNTAYAHCIACWVADIASEVFGGQPANLTCACGPK